MQLSLSTNVPATPEAAIPGAPAIDPLTGLPVRDPAATDAVSFEDLLPDGGTPAKPATTELGPDAEKSASILASMCWVPGMPPPPATTPEPAAPESKTGAMSSLGEGTAGCSGPRTIFNPGATTSSPVFCAVPSSRAFATKGGVPVDQNSVSPGEAKPVATESAMPATAPNVPEDGNAGGTILNTGVMPADAAIRTKPAANPAPAVTPDASEESTMLAAALAQPANPTAAPITRRPAILAAETGKPEAVTLSPGADVIAPADVTPSGDAALRGKVPASVDSTDQPAIPGRTEKIAADARAFAATAAPENSAAKKDFLNTGQATVNTAAQSVGIGVAQARNDMSAAPSNRPKSAPTVASVAHVTGTVATTSALSFTADAPAPAATLRETMTAVVNVVEALERRAETTQKAVDLQFHVGAERLALRVELRDGTVHTTFRTESPELRTALSHEWQAVTRTVVGSELRIADPVFAATPAGAGESASGSLGQGAPHQRGQQTPEPAPFTLPRDFSEPVQPDSAPENPSAGKSTTLLQAFA